MKILLVSGIYPPDIGGPATFIPQLADFLYSQGHDVTILSYQNIDSSQRLAISYAPFKVILIRRNQNKLVRTFLTIWKIFALSRRANITLLNGLFYEHSILRSFSKTPYIYKIVGDPVWEKYRNKVTSEITIEEFQQISLPPKYMFLRHILISGAEKARLVIVPGKDLQQIIEKWSNVIKVDQINNGVPCTLIEGVENDYDVISVSRLVNWKNIDTLMRACELAKMSLLVIGDGPERNNLENLAQNMNIEIDFLGEKLQEDVRGLLHKAEIYALISSYEGMSFSLLEAMMQERKILVSNIPANTNVIKNNFNGIVIENYDPVQIARKLLELKTFKKVNLKQNARETALLEYSLEEILKKYSLLIERYARG